MPREIEFGFPPAEVSAVLRIEGLVVLAGAITAFATLGGNWWLFALLILAPDLSFLGVLGGRSVAAWTYNAAHTYIGPATLAAIGWFSGAAWLLPLAAIWFAHIGMDRALGYGLKYPGTLAVTHLGPIGKGRKEKAHAHAG